MCASVAETPWLRVLQREEYVLGQNNALSEMNLLLRETECLEIFVVVAIGNW